MPKKLYLDIESYIILSHRRSLFSFDPRKDVIDIIVGIQRGLVQRTFMNELEDFLAGEGKDRFEKLHTKILLLKQLLFSLLFLLLNA